MSSNTGKKRQVSITSFFQKTNTEPTEIAKDNGSSSKKENVAENANKKSRVDEMQIDEPAEAISPKEEVEVAKASSASTSASSSACPFAKLAAVFNDIEATTKRLEITNLLSKFFIKVIKDSPEDLLPAIYLCNNQIGPTFEGLETGIGESLLMKAVGTVSGRSLSALKSEVEEKGDLGKVAQACRSNQKTMFSPKPLTIKGIFNAFREIANMSGKNSVQRKVDKIVHLMISCQGSEVKYLIRILEGKLRIGLAEKTVLTSLASAAIKSNPNYKFSSSELDTKITEGTELIKSVFNEVPNYDLIVPALLEHGIFELAKHCKISPGTPLKPMLAHPTKSLAEVLDRFENRKFTCEYKYDGERAQIHRMPDGKILIFSRNSENMSPKYPDVSGKIAKALTATTNTFIIDSEVVAWDAKKNRILPFQVLSTRKRKDVKTADIEVQICIFSFDLLYLNGESLLHKTFEDRRKMMYDAFKEVEGDFGFAKHMEGQTEEEIQTYLTESVKDNCEGLMIKTIVDESSYEPSKRSRNWLKVKKDYLDGMGDSVDLVVIGGYFGKGKRTGGYGGYLLACYDPDMEEYQTICKIGSGFSDADLTEHYKFFRDHVTLIPKPYYRFSDAQKPDVWFEPKQVWEVSFADLSISPVYLAGVGLADPAKGISLRFPRFLRVREDKSPENATTSAQIAEFYQSQAVVKNNVKSDDEN